MWFHTFKMEYMQGILGFLYIIWIFHVTESLSPKLHWGEKCPLQCQCDMYDLSQTLLARWGHEKGQVKSAMCVFQTENLQNIYQLPKDTEAFTFLQASHGSNITLDQNVMTAVANVKSMDIQGSPSKGYLQITDDIFYSMQHLKYLSLQRVDLNSAKKAFAKLQSLEVLHVINCNVVFLKWEMLDGLSTLQELYLIQNGIKELFDFAFYGTPELRRLFLSHNELFSVDADDLVGLLKLEHLDLSNNKIDHLSGLTFPPMPHLQWLELKHNPIRVIFPHCFQFLNGTQHLTLGHKQQAVHLMKFSFRGLFSLIFLHIPNIDNDVLNEHMFFDLQSLLHLNLQGRVKIINPRAFNGAHKVLQKLILHGCQLEKIMDNAFQGLHKLRTLDLSTNHLKYLPEGVFDPLEAIEELILSDNLFKSLPAGIFQGLQGIKALRLDANPWNCNCNMSEWKEDVMTKMPEVITIDCKSKSKSHCREHKTSYIEDTTLVPKCEQPPVYQGQSVFEALKYLDCKNEIET